MPWIKFNLIQKTKNPRHINALFGDWLYPNFSKIEPVLRFQVKNILLIYSNLPLNALNQFVSENIPEEKNLFVKVRKKYSIESYERKRFKNSLPDFEPVFVDDNFAMSLLIGSGYKRETLLVILKKFNERPK